MNSNLNTWEKKEKPMLHHFKLMKLLICHIRGLPRTSLMSMPFFLAVLKKTRWAVIKAGSQRRETLVLIIMPSIYTKLVNQSYCVKGKSKTSSVQPKSDKHFSLIVLCELETYNQLSQCSAENKQKNLIPFSVDCVSLQCYHSIHIP